MRSPKVYIKNPEFVDRQVAGEHLLIPIKRNLQESNNLYVLNEMGASIWKRIDGKTSLERIQSGLLDEFDVSPERLEEDLRKLLEDLISIEAIRELGEPPSA